MRRRGNLKEYIASLEKEFSLIENGFKEEEKRALTDYKSNDNEYAKNLAFLAYKSVTYQVRMYGVFLFGYLSEQDDILAFMRDEVSKDDNWRVQEVLAKAFDEFCKKKGYEKALPIIDEWLKNNNPGSVGSFGIKSTTSVELVNFAICSSVFMVGSDFPDSIRE